MNTSDPSSSNHSPRSLRVRGRERGYLERRRIGRHEYYLLERIGAPWRKRFLAFDPRHGPGGQFFLVQTWRGELARQQLRVFRRLKDRGLPQIVEMQNRGEELDVVLSWQAGLSLADYQNHLRAGRRPAVAPAEAIRLIHGLANAVCQLHHGQQVVHGDIQPANLVLTSHPSRLAIIDFGSAWTTDIAALRETGDGVHPVYAAPELLAGECRSGFHADQFSVAVVLYELLTEQLPYEGLGGQAGRPGWREKAAATYQPPSALSAACRELPRSLRTGVDEVTQRGLALDPAARFPDRHAWLQAMFELSARLRLRPERNTAAIWWSKWWEWFWPTSSPATNTPTDESASH